VDRRRGSVLTRLHLDGPLLLGTAILCAIGLVVLYSAGDQGRGIMLAQGGRILFGLLIMVTIAQIHPQILARMGFGLYCLGVFLLGAVLLVGMGKKGAERWLDLGVFSFQPSEIMKLAMPLMAAAFLEDKALPPDLRRTLFLLVLIALPTALILKQPDLGTAILISSSGLAVLFLAGLSWRFILVTVALGLGAAPALWHTLHEYQRQRILTLFDPDRDPLGTGYHIIQSRIAVGSGGLHGKGWLHGTQSHLEFLPERKTDFIFAVFCEEFGFLGVLGLLAAYAFVIHRALTIAAQAQDSFGRLLAGSLGLILFVYVFVNMGMVTGQLPVVGVPLPFVSFGGTSLVTLMAGFGLLMSIHTHRRLLS
jgi:rod shape determining protein RodA